MIVDKVKGDELWTQDYHACLVVGGWRDNAEREGTEGKKRAWLVRENLGLYNLPETYLLEGGPPKRYLWTKNVYLQSQL